MPKLKILITGDNGPSLPSPFGGIMKHCLLTAREFKKDGHEIALHVYHQHNDEDDLGAGARYFFDFKKQPSQSDKIFFIIKNFFADPAFFLSILKLEYQLLPEYDWSLMLFCAARAVLLDREIKSFAPDIIVTETAGLKSLVSIEVAKKNHLPVVLENYAEILFRGGSKNENDAPRYAKLWTYLVDNADLVVSTSEHCAQGPHKYIADRSKLRIIYSGISFEAFNKAVTKTKEELRKKFVLPADKNLVMSVGSLRIRKGHDHLFEALLSLSPEERQEIFVVICGMGDREELIAHAKSAGFQEDSFRIFQGLSEADLAELYSAVDCFCFPSITPRECMGLALKEAMAVGLPVAAYDSGGIKEAVEDGVNGYLVPVGDKAALGVVIRRVLSLSGSEKIEMCKRNKIKAGRLFDLRSTSALLIHELETLTINS